MVIESAVSHKQLGDFVQQCSNTAEMSARIACAMQGFFEEQNKSVGDFYELPSIMSLAAFFGVSHLIVHDAFQVLRKTGFDYQLEGLETPILFWQNPQRVF